MQVYFKLDDYNNNKNHSVMKTYPQVLKTFSFSAVIAILLPNHHLYHGCIHRIHLAQFCYTVSCNHHTPLVNQSPTADQLPVRSLI